MSDQNEAALDQLEQESIEGEAARQLIENELFKRAWDEAEADLSAQIDEVSLGDRESHSKLIIAIKILRTVRGSIEKAMVTGQNARIILSEPRRFGLFPRKKA